MNLLQWLLSGRQHTLREVPHAQKRPRCVNTPAAEEPAVPPADQQLNPSRLELRVSVATPELPVVPAGCRLVPALVGRPESAQHVWIACPDWCHIRHATDRKVAVEDIWHSGDFVDLELPHRDGAELLAYFRLGLNPYSSDENKRRPFIFAEDANTAMGYYMDPAHVDALCDKAEKSITQLRAMARACRPADQTAVA